MKIIFAQGNPEPDYAKTRHNIGFEILNFVANQHNLKWLEKPKFNALVTEFLIGTEKVLLVKPTTFYNETGLSARKIIDFYKIDTSKDFLVIHDELALDFGVIRIRQQGSDAGNNGIKSLSSHLGDNYHRVRIGIANKTHEFAADADFVLSKLSLAESKQLQADIAPTVVDLISDFCRGELKITSLKFDK